MKSIDDLTIKQVQIPAGRSISKDDLEIAERALLKLLHSYTEEVMKPNLRCMLQREIEQHPESPESAFLLDYNLMKPAELYQLINAAQILGKYLFKREYQRIERRAANGDPEAIEDLECLK